MFLSDNYIGDEGAHHLSNALQINTVSHILTASILFLRSSFTVDTHNRESFGQKYRPRRGPRSGERVANEQSESHFQPIDYISTIIIHYRHSQLKGLNISGRCQQMKIFGMIETRRMHCKTIRRTDNRLHEQFVTMT